MIKLNKWCKLPIYPGHWAVFDDVDQAVKSGQFSYDLHPTQDPFDMFEKAEGLTGFPSSHDVAIWLRYGPDDDRFFSTLSHELYHAINWIMHCAGQTPDRINHEADAYLVSHMFDEVLAAYRKRDAKRK